jgi:hypothetical protein
MSRFPNTSKTSPLPLGPKVRAFAIIGMAFSTGLALATVIIQSIRHYQ